MRPPPEICPVCGEDVPPRAKACPECGADDRTGWKDDANTYDALDLPDEVYEDEERPSRRPSDGIPLFWKLVGAALISAVLYWRLRGLF